MRTAENRRRPAVLFVVVLALLAAACGDDGDGGELRGFVREPAPDVSDLALPDASQDGASFDFAADDGEVLLVYFGYTSCPDVCPTTLSDVRIAMRELGEDAERVDLAMATIDPERDTPERLTDYVQSFFDGAHALTTPEDEPLRAAADEFGVTYSVTPAPDGGEPEVVHSGSLYAVDDEGQLLVTWPFGTPPDDYVNDLGVLLDEA